jgi:hypothetical protein
MEMYVTRAMRIALVALLVCAMPSQVAAQRDYSRLNVTRDRRGDRIGWRVRLVGRVARLATRRARRQRRLGDGARC